MTHILTWLPLIDFMLPRSAVATSLSRCISTAFRAPVATRTFSTSLLRQKIEENISGARLQEMLQKQDTKPLLVDFYAEWCGPCKMLSPILHKLATTPDLVGGKEVDLVTVDVDSHMETAQKYGVCIHMLTKDSRNADSDRIQGRKTGYVLRRRSARSPVASIHRSSLICAIMPHGFDSKRRPAPLQSHVHRFVGCSKTTHLKQSL